MRHACSGSVNKSSGRGIRVSKRRGARYAPFDMAMEEPDARVIGPKSEDDVSVRVHKHRVPTHRHSWHGAVVRIRACFLFGAEGHLELVSMKMEGVFAGVVVV